MLIVSDLDGTLTFDGQRPASTLVDVLEKLAERPDVRLVLATARSPRCLREWFGALAHRIDLICCNGALHLPPGGLPATAKALPPAAFGTLIERLDRAGVGWCAEYGDHFVARDGSTLPWFGTRHRRILGRGEDPPATGVLKVSVEDSRRGVPAAAGLPGIVSFPHATNDMDVVAQGVDKAQAVARLGSSGIADLALGNDLNDLALLRSARRALVVGEGLPALDSLRHVRRIAARPQAVEQALAEAVPQIAIA